MKFILLTLTIIPPIAFGSLANYEARWSKRVLSVCFSNGTSTERINLREDLGVSLGDIVEFSNEEKQTILSVLKENYSLADVGITFTGFQDCHLTPKADVHVLKFISQDPKTPAGWASGTGNPQISTCHNPKDGCTNDNNEYQSNGEQHYIGLNFPPAPGRRTSDEDRLQLLTLHEFGHIAGLYHEHVRPERDSDVNCRDRSQEFGPPWELWPEEVFGPYDSNSVMNYCYLRMVDWVHGVEIFTTRGEELPILLTDPSIYSQYQVGNHVRTVITPKLSSGDRETLRCLYVYEGNVFKNRCGTKSLQIITHDSLKLSNSFHHLETEVCDL